MVDTPNVTDARQELDDLTVLQNVENRDMSAILNRVTGFEVNTIQGTKGELETINQGSDQSVMQGVAPKLLIEPHVVDHETLTAVQNMVANLEYHVPEMELGAQTLLTSRSVYDTIAQNTETVLGIDNGQIYNQVSNQPVYDEQAALRSPAVYTVNQVSDNQTTDSGTQAVELPATPQVAETRVVVTDTPQHPVEKVEVQTPTVDKPVLDTPVPDPKPVENPVDVPVDHDGSNESPEEPTNPTSDDPSSGEHEDTSEDTTHGTNSDDHENVSNEDNTDQSGSGDSKEEDQTSTPPVDPGIGSDTSHDGSITNDTNSDEHNDNSNGSDTDETTDPVPTPEPAPENDTGSNDSGSSEHGTSPEVQPEDHGSSDDHHEEHSDSDEQHHEDVPVVTHHVETITVSNEVEVAPIYKTVTTSSSHTVSGHEYETSLNDVVGKKSTVEIDLKGDTHSIEMEFKDWNTGSAKLHFYNDGVEVDTVSQSHENGASTYNIGKTFDRVDVENNTNSGTLDVSKIHYTTDATTVTTTTSSQVLDTDAMQAEHAHLTDGKWYVTETHLEQIEYDTFSFDTSGHDTHGDWTHVTDRQGHSSGGSHSDHSDISHSVHSWTHEVDQEHHGEHHQSYHDQEVHQTETHHDESAFHNLEHIG